MKPIIRQETAADVDGIRAVTERAFADHPHSNQTEHRIIDSLRESGAMTYSFVAEIQGEIVGHLALTNVTVGDAKTGWFGLGPMAVDVPLQRRGIGSKLVMRGISHLQSLNASGCALLGAPTFYGRFGFQSSPEVILPGFPSEYVLVRTLNGPAPSGAIRYHPAFFADYS